MTRAPCRRRTGNSVLRAEKFGDLMTFHHRVFEDGCESRNNHRYQVVVPDLAIQWIQSFPYKTKNFSGDGKEFHGSFWSRMKSRTSLTLTIRWNLAHLVKFYHGIIVLPHFVDLGQMGLPKERYAEKQKGHLRYYCISASMKRGGMTLRKLLADRRTMRDYVGQPCKELISPLGAMVEYFPIQTVKVPPFWWESPASNTHRISISHGGDLERRHSGRRR